MNKERFRVAATKYRSRVLISVYAVLCWTGVVMLIGMEFGTPLNDRLPIAFRQQNLGPIIILCVGVTPLMVIFPIYVRNAKRNPVLYCPECHEFLGDSVSSSIAIACGRCPKCGEKVFDM